MRMTSNPPVESHDAELPTTPRKSEIRTLVGLDEMKDALDNNQDKVVAIRFFSRICRPCAALGAKFTDWAEDYSQEPVYFVDIDVLDEKNKPLRRQLGVRKVPLVSMYLHGEEVEKFMCGPTQHNLFVEKLESQLEKLKEDDFLA